MPPTLSTILDAASRARDDIADLSLPAEDHPRRRAAEKHLKNAIQEIVAIRYDQDERAEATAAAQPTAGKDVAVTAKPIDLSGSAN